MAKNNIRIVDQGGLNTVPTVRWQTEANATAIYRGEFVKLKAAGSKYVIPWATNDLTPGTDTMFVGLAASDSTHTASADGFVDVYIPYQYLTYEAKAKTAADVDTQAKIDAMAGIRKKIDLTTGTYTVDEAATDSVSNSLLIVGGNPSTRTLKFMVRPWVNTVDGA